MTVLVTPQAMAGPSQRLCTALIPVVLMLKRAQNSFRRSEAERAREEFARKNAYCSSLTSIYPSNVCLKPEHGSRMNVPPNSRKPTTHLSLPTPLTGPSCVSRIMHFTHVVLDISRVPTSLVPILCRACWNKAAHMRTFLGVYDNMILSHTPLMFLAVDWIPSAVITVRFCTREPLFATDTFFSVSVDGGMEAPRCLVEIHHHVPEVG